jgi:hypothetical protein
MSIPVTDLGWEYEGDDEDHRHSPFSGRYEMERHHIYRLKLDRYFVRIYLITDGSGGYSGAYN